jgi:hypothetical protein
MGTRPAGASRFGIAGLTSASAARRDRLTQHLDAERASENGDRGRDRLRSSCRTLTTGRTREAGKPPERRSFGVIALFIRAALPAAEPGLAGRFDTPRGMFNTPGGIR